MTTGIEDDNIRRQVEALHTRYIRVIDDDRLEEWPDLFTEDCLYKIITRENFDQGMPLAIMECRGRGMLQDRITGLRRINVYEPQRYLHQTSGLIMEQIAEQRQGKAEGTACAQRISCRSNYLVVRTLIDGAMSLFSAGIYLDRIRLEANRARFEERLVITDSRRVDTLLVIPI